MDEWDDTSVGDAGVSEELVEFIILSDGVEQVSGNDSGLGRLFGGVSGELQELSGQVFEDGSHIDWGSGADSFGVLVLPEESGNSSDGEGESCSR